MVIYVAVYLPTFTDVVWTKLTRCFARLISIGMQLHIYIYTTHVCWLWFKVAVGIE